MPTAPADPFAAPDLDCDVVMKGGITSGIVYPLAVCELARRYRFRSVGGTSAGAIAAAATAAAEYGRRHGTGRGFRGLQELPAWLGRDRNLVSLFQPQPGTEAIYRTGLAFLARGGAKPLRVALAAAGNFPLGAIVGALPGLLLAAAAARGVDGGWGLAPVYLLGAAVAAAGALLGAAASLVAAALRALPANGFGLCSGLPSPDADRPALTPWLAGLIADLSGKTDPERPLTFGDLWGPDRGQKEIDLQAMTTNLTHGRPYGLPFEESIYYFDPVEWRRLFPEEIVRWMEAHPRRSTSGRALPAGLRRFPAPEDVPVVVAARLSLSFPVLLSAVPLHAIDFSREVPDERARVPERCWFSDGGISSNFPVHFFDAPLPRWPTFGINLRPFHPDHPKDDARQCDNVFMPTSNVGGTREWWRRFEGKGVAGFLAAIFNALQNWRDNVQLTIPGYRDRVAHVSLADGEGGLNLDMPPAVIAALSERGRCAGELLRHRYADPPEPGVAISWDNHRWTRYRAFMLRTEEMLGRAGAAFHAPDAAGGRSYAELIERGPNDPPESFRFRRMPPPGVLDATTHLVGLPGRWAAAGVRFADGAPESKTELRIVPRA